MRNLFYGKRVITLFLLLFLFFASNLLLQNDGKNTVTRKTEKATVLGSSTESYQVTVKDGQYKLKQVKKYSSDSPKEIYIGNASELAKATLFERENTNVRVSGYFYDTTKCQILHDENFKCNKEDKSEKIKAFYMTDIF